MTNFQTIALTVAAILFAATLAAAWIAPACADEKMIDVRMARSASEKPGGTSLCRSSGSCPCSLPLTTGTIRATYLAKASLVSFSPSHFATSRAT